MKVPKTTNRFCPHCKKKTEHKIKVVGTGFSRGTMTRGGGRVRARLRGLARGIGNLGKWGSKPAQAKHKRKSKTTKKTNLMYTCQVCKKSKYQKKGQRAGKVLQE
jgi:ribosomal protein L44E